MVNGYGLWSDRVGECGFRVRYRRDTRGGEIELRWGRGGTWGKRGVKVGYKGGVQGGKRG